MQLDTIAIKNFHCFGPDGVSIELADPVTALIGANGSGKAVQVDTRKNPIIHGVDDVPDDCRSSELGFRCFRRVFWGFNTPKTRSAPDFGRTYAVVFLRSWKIRRSKL
jgi:hypothetical protein